jgi:hypothetical protein
MLLGEMLLSDGTLRPDQVEEALAAQVINGGRLGTNLVELGHLTEEQLARALGKQHGVAAAWGEIVPSPQALSMVDSNFADDKDVLPVRVEGNRLWLLIINPDDLQTQDLISARAGKRIVPVVVPEFRMAQLQRRYCKAFRPVREVDIEALRRSWRGAEQAQANNSAELMNEEEFQALYAAAMRGGVGAQEQVEEAVIVEEQSEAEFLEAVPEPAALEEIPTLELGLEEIEQKPAPRPQNLEELERRRTVERRARQERPEDSKPLTFLEAQKELAGIVDRDDIARIVLRFAAGKFARALLLSIRGDFAIGWHGAGKGLLPGLAPAVAIPLKNQSAFKLVRDSRSHFLGPLRRDFATQTFLRTLGGDEPRSAVLMPILAAGRVVNILYGDGGPGQFASPDVGELLILAQRVGRSYEQMIAARKASARKTGAVPARR